MNGSPARLVPIAEVELRNYMRLTVRDVPGVLGRITSHFGMKGISISSIRQPDAKHGQPVPIVIVTHRVRDEVLTRAIETLEQAGLLLAPPVRIRIEEGW
jgi:homoserine dehydrogenase